VATQRPAKAARPTRTPRPTKTPRGAKKHGAAPTPTPGRHAAPGSAAAPEAEAAPKPVTRVMPVYPPQALKQRVRGIVVLRIVVDERGRPADIQVEQGARSDLNDAAVEAARHWVFEPGRKDGKPVRSTTRVRFPFEGVQFARTPLP
jgi:protein TonB